MLKKAKIIILNILLIVALIYCFVNISSSKNEVLEKKSIEVAGRRVGT